MSVLLSKILSTAIHPLNFTLYLLIAAGLARWMGLRKLSGLASVFAIAWLWFWSAPYTAEPILSQWEQRHPPTLTELAPTADLIYVLGGGVSGASIPSRPEPELGGASDRVWAGARLYQAGKAPMVMVSGGTMAWRGITRSEAEGMSLFLSDLGVPVADQILESASQTTYENAIQSRPLIEALGATRVLLVTSAFHMQRSLAVHQAAMPNIEWIPFSTDIKVVPRQASLMQWLPAIDVLESSQQYLRERVGIWVYAMRGWL